jgi:hypothetical protein
LPHFDKTSPAGYDENTMTVYRRFLSTTHSLRCTIAVPILIIVCLTLLGCQSSIEIVTPAATSVLPIVTAVPQAHAVAIVGVDFDPALDYNQILSNGGITLLVAVENRGLTAETNVVLEARLLDMADKAGPRELLNDMVTIRSLAPGEVHVVRFNQVADLPVRERYKLVTELSPVRGERELSDNVRSFDILVHDGK